MGSLGLLVMFLTLADSSLPTPRLLFRPQTEIRPQAQEPLASTSILALTKYCFCWVFVFSEFMRSPTIAFVASDSVFHLKS